MIIQDQIAELFQQVFDPVNGKVTVTDSDGDDSDFTVTMHCPPMTLTALVDYNDNLVLLELITEDEDSTGVIVVTRLGSINLALNPDTWRLEHPADLTGFTCKARTIYDEKIAPTLLVNVLGKEWVKRPRVADLIGTPTGSIASDIMLYDAAAPPPLATVQLNQTDDKTAWLSGIETVDLGGAKLTNGSMVELDEAKAKIVKLEAQVAGLVQAIETWAPNIILPPEVLDPDYESSEASDDEAKSWPQDWDDIPF